MAAHLYVDVQALKVRLGLNSDRDVQVLTSAAAAASRAVDQHCGRRFWCDTGVSARTYAPSRQTNRTLVVEDIAETTGLIVAYGTDGVTFGTTVAATDYQLDPANGIGPDGNSGWPYERIELITGSFPCAYARWPQRRTVQVTAKWGWLAVPEPVREACAMVAADLFHLKDNRFGVAGINDFGPIRVGENRIASGMLDPYRRMSAIVAVA